MRRPAASLRELAESVERTLRAARLHYGHGTQNSRDEAAYLVLRGLRLAFETPADTPLTPGQVARVERLVERRVRARVPVAYLLREAWLDGCPFYVDERVIIPRSHIAELLAAKLRPWMKRAPRSALDLCTGSGCLAILAARAFPRAEVDASDVSKDALAVARRNVATYKLQHRVRLVRSDLFSTLPRERYDLIVSNPPYVTRASMRALPSEYRHEPALALAGGADGLELVRRIIEQAPARLTARGVLVCEIGANRKALERAYPRLPFVWPGTAAGVGQVFLLPASALSKGMG
jgi:ribosomal protein L3 glutamine methyltransferase